MTQHTFKFTLGEEVSFECDSFMPYMLYDKLKEVVKNFNKDFYE